MIKECKFCGIKFQSNGRRKYHSAKCKKDYENSLRSAPELRGEQGALWTPSEMICKPARLKGRSADIWDTLGPTLISRGHLNVLSADIFAEYCHVTALLEDINAEISNAAELHKYVHGRGTRESVFSELKRQYSKQQLDLARELYLTPKSNRGNYQLNEGDGKQEPADKMFD